MTATQIEETLAERAKRLRKAKGFTRKDLADRVGCTDTHVYHIETGRRKRMQAGTLERYAQALEVSPQYLDVGYDPAPEPDQWPNLSVLLRHTRKLSEEEIDQVNRFVEALEMQHQMEHLAQGSGGQLLQLNHDRGGEREP